MVMLTGLRRKGQWRSVSDSNGNTDSRFASVAGDLCPEDFGDRITAGSDYTMSHAERYEFVKNRKYYPEKPSDREGTP
jgi:hypothetical protein